MNEVEGKSNVKFDLTSILKNKAARGSQNSEQLLIISEHAGSEIELSDGDLQAVSGGHRHDYDPCGDYGPRYYGFRHHRHYGGNYAPSNYGYYDQGNCDPCSGGDNSDGGYGGNYQSSSVVFVTSSSSCGY